jgi:hypothetical protein
MRQFSIHKVNKPVMRRAEEEEVSSGKTGEAEAHYEQPSVLTPEEQEALQPKEIKVVNPWIHEATHKEYLESVKVSHTSYLGHLFGACLPI